MNRVLRIGAKEYRETENRILEIPLSGLNRLHFVGGPRLLNGRGL